MLGKSSALTKYFSLEHGLQDSSLSKAALSDCFVTVDDSLIKLITALISDTTQGTKFVFSLSFGQAVLCTPRP